MKPAPSRVRPVVVLMLAAMLGIVTAGAVGCAAPQNEDPTQGLNRSDYRQKTQVSPYRQPG